MNFIEVVEDWKSNDEWRYADKEAAWKFFFAAGKESSQAVISAQCVKMSQYESIIFELRRQLASAEEHNNRMQEAWNAIEINSEECLDFDECTAMLVSIDDYHKLMEAVAGVKGEQ